MTSTLKQYIKANKRMIINNWQTSEFIREKHNYSILNYIYFHIEHISNSFKCSHETPELKEFSQYLYKTI